MNPIDRSDSHGLHPRGVDQLLDYLPAGVVVHDAASRVVYANRFAYKLLGPTLDAMRTQTALAGTWPFLRTDGSPMPPADYPVTRVLRSGQAVADCVVGVGTVKLDRWLICNAYPVRDAAGELAEVVVCFSDCTELKLAERSLAVSEERLRLALLGSTDASWDWDLPVNHVHYSDRWWDMLGYDAGQERDSGAWRTMMHPNDGERVDAFIAALRDARDTSYSIEFRLRHRDGHYVPILSRGFIQRDAAGKALRISGTNTDLTETKRAESRIYELAYFDYLTGLPNRRLLIEQLGKILTRAARTGQHGALLFIDLDNFKLLNDTLGHDVGDHLLRQVAERLRHTVRESDHLARLGGDEFVVVLENLGESEAAAVHESQAVGGKLLAALAQPYYLAGRPSVSTPSVGVAVFGAGATSVELLLRQADLAMYRAKAEGRNTVRFFDPSMQAAADRQIELENDLRDGIRRGHFELHCQPQFDLDGALAGGEVLVRWRHDVRGLVLPGEFIGLAEACGLRPDRTAREAGAGRVLPRAGALGPRSAAAPGDAGGQRQRPPAARARLRRQRARLRAGQRRQPAPLVPGADRKRVRRERRGRLREDERAARPRHRLLAGRLRHRLLLAELPAALPAGGTEGRPRLRQGPAGRRPRRGDRRRHPGARAHARPDGGGRGRRDARAARLPGRARLPGAAGLSAGAAGPHRRVRAALRGLIPRVR